MWRILLFTLLSLCSTQLMSQNFSQDWKKIEALGAEGKYRSALGIAEDIYRKADAAGVTDQQLKALFYRVAYVASLEENGQETAIRLLRSTLEAEDEDLAFRAVNQHLLGRYLYSFAGSYDRQMSDRTAEAGSTVDWELPLAEWSLPLLYATGTEYLLAALENGREARMPLTRLPAIVDLGANLEDRLPTLYDALVNATLSQLSTGYASLPEPEYVFTPGADLLLQPVLGFIRAEPATRDTSGLSYRTLRIYQQLLTDQLDSRNRRAAFVFTNLKRLQWGYQLTGDAEAYNAALKAFYREYQKAPGAGNILLARAQLLMDQPSLETAQDDDERFSKVRALALLDEVVTDFPDTEAAQQALQIKDQLLHPEMRIQAEEVLLKDQPALVGITYRNVDRLYYQVIKKSFDLQLNVRRMEAQDISRLARPANPVIKTVVLADNDDYQQHQTEIKLDALPSGQYHLIISTDADFDYKKGLLLHQELQVSNLAAITLEEGSGKNRAVITDRLTGAPVAGARVRLYSGRGFRSGQESLLAERTSDARGNIELPNTNDRYSRLMIDIATNNDRVVQSLNYNSRYDRPRDYQQTRFFLDRGLYRPGQTLYAKGLSLSFDQDRVPTIMKNAAQTITLNDANGQTVATQEVKTDDFGAFSVSFTLPEGGLNGRYNLFSSLSGNQSFRVEAYKRPRFEVTFDDYDQPVSAGDSVTVTGHALGYAGPPVADGRVTYRVVRETVDYWYGYYRGGGRANVDAVLATGTAVTDEDGDFRITFPAKLPQRQQSGPSWRHPHYQFKVYADVADQTGETHAGSTMVRLKREDPAVALEVEDLLDQARNTPATVTVRFSPVDENDRPIPAMVSIQAIRHPDPGTKERYWPLPDRPVMSKQDFKQYFPAYAYAEVRPQEEWPLQRDVNLPELDRRVELGKTERFPLDISQFPVGHYRLTLSYRSGGETRQAVAHFSVYASDTGNLPVGMGHLLTEAGDHIPPGQPATFTLLTAAPLPLVLNSWYSAGTKKLGERTTVEKVKNFTHQVTDADRGGLGFKLAFIHDNRLYAFDRRIVVPWPTKELTLSYETFRDKLRPGEEETWTIRIKDHAGQPVSAQLLASMYDASLDAIEGFSWSGNTRFFAQQSFYYELVSSGNFRGSNAYAMYPTREERARTQYELPSFDFSPIDFYSFNHHPVMLEMAMQESEAPRMMRSSAPPPPPPPPGAAENLQLYSADSADASAKQSGSDGEEAPVSIRTNLQETAFFFPEIRAAADGSASINFTTPEALTKWKLQLLAHTPDLASAYDTKEIITQKELMILPNAPRFLREGDRLNFTAKVSNLSEQNLDGTAVLEIFDPETEAVLGNFVEAQNRTDSQVPFQLAAGKSQTVSWTIGVPDGSAGLIGYRVTARSGNFSDGEQNVLPVLTNRVFLTATKSFFLRPGQDKTVELDALLTSGGAAGKVVNSGYSFELTDNPAWLAVKALPYLTEYPYDCTEQMVNRFFANQLSASIVEKKPALRAVFEAWQADPEALKSPLEKNQRLKQALLEETPWVREAASESEQQARLAVLFDLERISREQEATLAKLEQRQRSDGSFSWFPDGPENTYMTQYVVEALLRLRELKALDQNTAQRAAAISKKTIGYLDDAWAERYRKLMERLDGNAAKSYYPATSEVHYLYVRSYFLGERPFNAAQQKMWDFYHARAKANWTKYGLYEQALLANTFSRTDAATGRLIIASLREIAKRSDEFGLYWKYPPGWSWQQLPVETHCRIFEAFLLNGGTQEELDEMRLYLLQDKRTNRWETTKATAAAVHALLLQGTDWTTDRGKVQVAIPGIAPATILAAADQAEAGTGYYQVQVPADDVRPAMGKVTLNNRKQTIAWGGMYWQFTQDIDAVQAQNADGPLNLSRGIFRRINTPEGERLVAVDAQNQVQPGDRLVVRLTVRADRNFEYVHLKDRRASGLEPTEQLSGYRYKGGLGFYFSPDDLAVNFFFDYLPKGTHTLEYDLFVNHRGDFSNGLSVVQSMYAPEFSGYSEGSRLMVE